MGSRVTLELFESIQHGSESITELSLRRLKAKDLKLIRDPDNITMTEQIDLISKLSGQPKSVIEELDAVDVAKAGEIIRGFTETGPKIGASSSD